MPIKIPNTLPAAEVLGSENIFIMNEERARTQDIRPLRIALVNLMPDKITTETQFARLLSNTPLQIELELVHMRSHASRHTAAGHLQNFYSTFDDIRGQKFDGMVITGAPVERMDFEEVDYWPELTELMDWSKSHVYSTLHICWAAQAGLYHHFGINKVLLENKLSGVFEHTVTRRSNMLFRGCDDYFYLPHSRHTDIDEQAVRDNPALKILAASEKAGIFAVSTEAGRQIFFTGHAEYDRDTLDREYRHDVKAGLAVPVPDNYYVDDDPEKAMRMTWRAHAHLIFANWLNYFVYQETPFNLQEIS
jgi:homoserine O-succinyltransferase